MKVLESDSVVCIDVDDTLVSWKYIDPTKDKAPHPECDVILIISSEGIEQQFWTFPFNIESLKVHKHKGHKVIVWSGSGADWARRVVYALELENYVDIVMAKPRWLLDDMMPSDFMPRPYWGGGDPGKHKLK